jgi:hypothetical protein
MKYYSIKMNILDLNKYIIVICEYHMIHIQYLE